MTPSGGARILVVDDEPSIQQAVRLILSRHGYHVDVASTGQQAIEAAATSVPDLIILDLGLPDVGGHEVISQIRARASTPIVVLSVRGAERDKVEALDRGADDYLTKPFGVAELLARIRVALRHASAPTREPTTTVEAGALSADLEKRIVRVGDREMHLTPTEYELLKVFLVNPGKVLTAQMLIQGVWGPQYGSEAHYLHVYVARLRKKLGITAQAPGYIATEPGVGYRLLTEDG